jgi:hypothetical protein
MIFRRVSWWLGSLPIALLACGGEVSPIGSPARAVDAGGPRADAGRDASDEGDQGSGGGPSCGTRPLFEDGGEYLGCAYATCPSETVCVEVEGDTGEGPSSCVTVPSGCDGVPSCACMGTLAFECVTHTVTPPGPGEGCQSVTHDGVPLIAFTCLDCDQTQGR